MDHSKNFRARASTLFASAFALMALTLAGCAVVDRSAPPAIASSTAA